jgi:hypothetical protein
MRATALLARALTNLSIGLDAASLINVQTKDPRRPKRLGFWALPWSRAVTSLSEGLVAPANAGDIAVTMANDLHTAITGVGAIFLVNARAAIAVSITVSVVIAGADADTNSSRTRAYINILRARRERQRHAGSACRPSI